MRDFPEAHLEGHNRLRIMASTGKDANILLLFPEKHPLDDKYTLSFGSTPSNIMLHWKMGKNKFKSLKRWFCKVVEDPCVAWGSTLENSIL